MARKERRDNSKLRELMEGYGVKTMEDVQNFIRMLTAETIQTALDAELESELGYSKYDYKNKNTDNSRNGYSQKLFKVVLAIWKSMCLATAKANTNRSW